MIWTEKDIEYFKKVFPWNPNKNLERYFKCNYSAIKNLARRLDLKKEIPNSGCFKKGHTPWNKGLKYSHINSGQFPLFHKPHNTKMEGELTIRTDTRTSRKYLYKKIGDNNWIAYNRYLWEKFKGKIPPGMLVVFKDGNSLNCNIENLMLISRKQNARRNHNRIKAAQTMRNTWQIERLRQAYGLPPKTRLMERCGT